MFSRRHGFTLIELLVVIGIISILASILFPVFSRAREKGRQTACLSNIHQIGLAFSMYAQDYEEVLPPGPGWWNTIYPYTHNKQIYACPDRKDLFLGYGLNYSAQSTGLGTFFDPAVKILLADASTGPIGCQNPVTWLVNDPTINPASPPDTDNETYGGATTLPARHNDGSNYAFVDGHSKWYRKDMVAKPYMWLPTVETP